MRGRRGRGVCSGMTGAIIWGIVVLALGVPFVLLWWRVADRWADEEHKRFRSGARGGDATPTVVRRSDIEGREPGDGVATPGAAEGPH